MDTFENATNELRRARQFDPQEELAEGLVDGQVVEVDPAHVELRHRRIEVHLLKCGQRKESRHVAKECRVSHRVRVRV
jgi:sirohydrochlorin ferrochelatase